MKYINEFSLAAVFLITSCGSNEKGDTKPVEVVTQNEIYGDWQLDSSSYLTNNQVNIVTPPMMPTTWVFDKDGKYLVKNSVELPGTFSVTSDSLFVVLMGVPNNYSILKLTETNLVLRATIAETDTTLLQTEAYLTRK